jgi:glutathione S-transferase
MQRPLLYTYRRCPYAIRAMMALLQAGIAIDAHEMLALSPKATVPVLVLPDGRVIEQSMDIIRWAFEGPDHAGWWGRADMPDNQALIERNDGPFKQHLDRYKYPQRHAPVDPTVGRDQAAACLLHLLEQRLASAAWLGGDAPCAADLAIFPFVRQFRAVDAGWFDAQPWPATRRWLQGWVEGEQFEACMRKLPSGISVGFGAL